MLEAEPEVVPPSEGISGDATAQWAQVIQNINSRKRMLGAFLEESRFGGMNGAEVLLETDDLHANVIDEKENRALVIEALRSVFGVNVAFRCVRPGRPLARPPATNADVRPMIEEAIRFFDGVPIDVEASRTDSQRTGPPRGGWGGRKERTGG